MSNINKILAFQNMTLKKLITLQIDCNLKITHDEAKCFYIKLHNRLSSHSNPLIDSSTTYHPSQL